MDVYGTHAPTLPVWLLTAVATSEPRLWLYGSDLAHFLFRLAHFLGLAGFLGCVFVLNLRQLGCFATVDGPALRRPLLPVLEASFWVTVVSGLLLFLYDPIGAGLHSMFLPKLVLVVVGFVAAKWPHRGPRPLLRRGFAASSLAIWFLVMGASVWNHIEHPLNPADVLNLDDARESGGTP
jgi:hypothetical protein